MQNEHSAASQALEIIRSGKETCVVIKNDAIIHQDSGNGVKPLIKLYDAQREALEGAYVLDKIIGKAAAMILFLGKEERVYGEIMSEAALGFLTAYGMVAEYGKLVKVITSRDGTGVFPIENSVLEEDDAEAGLENIRETIKKLMAQK